MGYLPASMIITGACVIVAGVVDFLHDRREARRRRAVDRWISRMDRLLAESREKREFIKKIRAEAALPQIKRAV